MERHSIAWRTATAEEATFSVRLDGDVSQEWQDAFRDLAQRRQQEPRSQTWEAVTLASGWISVHEVEPATKAGPLHDYIRSLVNTTDESVESKRQSEHAQKLEAELDARNRARRAAELADELRNWGR